MTLVPFIHLSIHPSYAPLPSLTHTPHFQSRLEKKKREPKKGNARNIFSVSFLSIHPNAHPILVFLPSIYSLPPTGHRE